MNRRTGWKIAIVYTVCMLAFTSLACAKDVNEPDKKLKGEVRFRYDWLGVNKDRGRFREDNWMTDGSTGGLDWLHLESIGPDENGYEWLLEGKALYNYDYDLSFLVKKQDSHYIKLDFDGFRRYFDGSNEYWDESLYGLPSGSGGYGEIGGTSEHSDVGFFVDRRNYNIELGLTPPEGPHWVFGWHRMEKDGKEVLLRGGNTLSSVGAPEFRGIPALAHIRGITDTIYAEVSHTFAEKYNIRIRQEFEQYRDHQRIESPRYNASGTLNQYRIFIDEPGYTNWRTMFMFDSFLDEKTYVTANYMYDYLNNDTTRDEVRPNVASPDIFVNTRGGNSRRTNVGAFGYRRADALQIPKLDFNAGVRVEDSRTSSQGAGWSNTPALGAPHLREAMSKLDEVRVGETLRLVYRGFERTTLSFDADLEQRYLDWSEYEDVRSYEIHDAGSPDFLDRRADIDHTDQIYTFKAVHRFNKDVKSTIAFRLKDLKRSYTELFDNASGFSPGYLGSYRRKGNDLTVETDFRLNSNTSATLMYQFLQESIDTEIGGKTQNWEVHRGAGSISYTPTQNLFLVGTFMLENYKLDTPVNASATKYAPGTRPYDFRGNSYSLLLNGTYAFNKKTSCALDFQHTEALGTVDYAGDYVFDRVALTLKHQFAANKTIGLGYQFYNFNSHNGGSFDDYRAHGAFATYTYTF